MRVLYCGGTRHGTVWDPTIAPAIGHPLGVQTPTGVDPVPPKTLEHLDTGERYNLIPMKFTIPHPLNPNHAGTVYAANVYMWDQIGDPNVAGKALSDAAVQQWFRNNGLLEQSPPNGPGNGHAAPPPAAPLVPQVRYWTHCDQCANANLDRNPVDAVAAEREFVTALDRAKWMREHIETTGHQPGYADTVPTTTMTEGSDDGSSRIGDIQKG